MPGTLPAVLLGDVACGVRYPAVRGGDGGLPRAIEWGFDIDKLCLCLLCVLGDCVWDV